MGDYVVYYRVSTRRQGCSGLGLEAQREAVEKFVASRSGRIRASYTEIESGRKNHRPELGKAVITARESGGTLLVAKMDRLGRKAAFLLALRDSGVDFVCADMPEIDFMVLGVLAVLAQKESETNAERQRAVAAVKRAKGIPMGAHIPAVAKALERGRERSRESRGRMLEEWAEGLREIVTGLRKAGLSQEAVAEQLKAMGLKTAKGGKWTQPKVSSLLKRLGV